MRCRSILPVALCLGAAACGILDPRPDPTRWFVLATVQELDPTRKEAERGGETLGLGPLTFPDYAMGRELVSRQGPTGLAPSPDERWAEPLDEGIARVLASDLEFVTGARLLPYPWFATDAPAARVRIRFERFELEQRARAVLAASWRLENGSGEVLQERRFSTVRELTDPHGAGAVLELSQCLVELSEDIAAAWRSAAGRATAR